MKKLILPLTLSISVIFTGCGYSKIARETGADEHGFSAPSQKTIEHNAKVFEEISSFDDGEDFK